MPVPNAAPHRHAHGSADEGCDDGDGLLHWRYLFLPRTGSLPARELVLPLHLLTDTVLIVSQFLSVSFPAFALPLFVALCTAWFLHPISHARVLQCIAKFVLIMRVGVCA